jgi:hypothetical protein
MEQNKPWKLYEDEWNSDIINKDNNNKLSVSNSTEDETIITVNTEVEETKSVNNYSNITNEQINDIIKITNFKEYQDLVILDNIIKVLAWAINNCYVTPENYNYFVNNMKWICSAISYFINELNIKENTNKVQCGLIRSSYKLCPQGSNCIYQYPDNANSNNCCKFQHYPYASLYIDCISIINYIHSSFESEVDTINTSKTSKLIMALTKTSIGDKKFSLNELKRCLTTINFVFMIMYRELDIIDKCRKNESNYNIRKYHAYHAQFRFNDKNKRRYTKI